MSRGKDKSLSEYLKRYFVPTALLLAEKDEYERKKATYFGLSIL